MIRRWRRGFAARGRDEGGSILPLTALLLAVLMAVGAVAVDTGRLATSSRDLQGVTDRAALDALLEMRDAANPKAAAEAGAHASIGRNPGMAGSGMASPWVVHEAQPGRFDDGGSFIADDSARDGVRVILDSSVDSVFLPGTSDLRREAIVRQDTIASIAAGTTTARVERYDPDGSNAGLVAVLSGLLGLDIGLDVVGWQGIATTNIRLGALAAELAVGTVEELLDTRLTVNRLVDAMISAVARDGSTTAVELEQLSLILDPLPEIRLGEFLEIAGGDPALDTKVNALDLFMAAVQVANVDNAVAIDLGHHEIASITLRIIEPPVIAVGRAEKGHDGNWATRAKTAQTELELVIPLGGSIEGLGTIASGELVGDLRIRVATGVGAVELVGASCRAPGHLDVSATTAAVSVSVDSVQVARINVLDIAEIRVSTLPIDVDLAVGSTFATLEGLFPTDPHEVIASGGLDLGEALSGIELSTEVTLLGFLPVPSGLLSVVVSSVAGLVGAVLAPVDVLVGSVLEVLGVKAGVMDVWGVDLDCSGRYLVK